ncbi:hypothetical protein AALP_AA5G128100 [Arabis alpina]|uniref:Uncharacterized protein n=1 Tax=Arabis alpina TaxID=50452 RepID=A0A087GWQ5_ARAAL|nr:hypothetical protein AALP_AA5G128100 [Arabis alpina]
MVARALTRKGTALTKMAKCSKDYEPAIQAFQKALTEHRNPDTLKRLNEAKRAKKEWEQKDYFDPKIGDEERGKPIKGNPKDPKAYSNRAACYSKLGAMPEGLKDAKKCIELDPTFSKGYNRKAAVQFLMKEYDNAMETYQEGGGGIAGAFTYVCLHPLDKIKTKLETKGASRLYSSSFDAIVKTFQEKGILGFYSGVSAVIVGSSFSSAVYFGRNCFSHPNAFAEGDLYRNMIKSEKLKLLKLIDEE